jgi:hypothetical protein
MSTYSSSIFHHLTPDSFTRNARNYKVTEGFDPKCDMGPLVSDEQLDRVLGYDGSI